MKNFSLRFFAILVIFFTIFIVNNFTGANFTVAGQTACTGCGLGMPGIFPSSPTSSQPFSITCPANGRYDCIDAYVDGVLCSYLRWSGSGAIFNCIGLPEGTYTAKCASRAGTARNCCTSETTAIFTVLPLPSQSDQTGGASTTDIVPPQVTDIQEKDIAKDSVTIASGGSKDKNFLIGIGVSALVVIILLAILVKIDRVLAKK
jgi:hypothetical protein